MNIFTKGTGVVAISFILCLYLDSVDAIFIVWWFAATVLGAIACGVDVVEKFRNVK